MRFTVNVKSFLHGCQVASGAVGAAKVNPILANFKVTADKEVDMVSIQATDMEISVRHVCHADVRESGECLIPSGKIIPILRECTDDELTLSFAGDTVQVVGKSASYKLLSGLATEFPETPDFVKGDSTFAVQSCVLSKLLQRTVFAANRKDDSARFRIDGVLWEAGGNKLKMVGTDTKRLAFAEGACDGKAKDVSGLVPIRFVAILQKAIGEETTYFDFVGNSLKVLVGRTVFTTKLVEGRFPPYQQFLPKKFDVEIDLDLQDFLSSVRCAKIMSDDESCRVDMELSGGKVTMTARGADVGSSEVTHELKDDCGKSMKVAFDPDFLTEMGRGLPGVDVVKWKLIDSLKPSVFTTDDFLYLVMPMGERVLQRLPQLQ